MNIGHSVYKDHEGYMKLASGWLIERCDGREKEEAMPEFMINKH